MQPAPDLGSGVLLAAVTAEVNRPSAGLARLDALLEEAYESAISLTHDTAERQYLEHRRGR